MKLLVKIFLILQIFDLFSQGSVINNLNLSITGQYVNSTIQIDGYLSELEWQTLGGYLTVSGANTGTFPNFTGNRINKNDSGTDFAQPEPTPPQPYPGVYNTTCTFAVMWDTTWVYAAFAVKDPNLNG
ncbi:MAG: hypothetical protein NW207_00855, partial [Cytophagales bacterium]|nr:hypothetical protein [Cytophagales bacterium]